ncbi:acetyltransferase [Xanthomonas citri pv. glycines]|uniref:Acetyltransferase n=2 Tax=Xanthomonas TaxID=338 RepID=A0AAX0I355_XANCG|nr:1-acyl-sn-glycerol-3-phosphate acyltransferase [Xanthomonas citri pv. glycines str. 8ra]ARV21212.1 acetyltransferase [Xanthomonas citri pv. glycines str. 12-2]OEY91232.1 acetyltransferase [Xanthomonas citri pv. glycines]EWC50004.1 acetyltransferase [Xanthomonas citri pv. glycines str. 8ra]OOX04221.1 acetyltransferase [Xanthomonas citri pv. glycines]
MSESSLDATRDADGALRWFRYLYRVPLLLLHLCLGLPVTMLCVVVPALARIRIGHDDTLEERMIRWWQGTLMRVFGFRLRRFGTPLPGATLFVANHVSWVDISILHSQRVMGFVAKREIAGWPLVGWLATKGQTIFHQRGNTESLGGVLQEMLLRLQSGKPVGVFPEGRTRGGTEVGPFHARIFQAAVEAGVPVQPVALRYGLRGNAQAVVAFGERESFFANIVRLLGEPSRLAEVHFLEPIRALDIEGRRRMAETSRQRIVAAMES